jgi:predicted nucleic acid-binding protein
MGKRYLIDSNVIIDYASDRLPDTGAAFVEHLFDSDFLISVVVKIEVLGFDDSMKKLAALEDLLSAAEVLPLDDVATRQAIALRRKHKRLRLGDAIIAATALSHELTVLTRNTDDFSMIAGLEVVNPHAV